MRWKKKQIYKPTVGDIRSISKFLWLPKTLDEETRWLERVVYSQEYRELRGYDYSAAINDFVPYTIYKWVNLHWINE